MAVNTLDPNVKGDVEIKRCGEQLIVPEDMKLSEAITWLTRKAKEEEQEIRLNEIIECHPLEGAYALNRALQQKYGWTSLIPTPGFFGSNPPMLLSFETDVGVTTQVPWGRMQMPGIEGYIETGVETKDGRYIFRLGGIIRQKNKHDIAKLMDLARSIASKDSIYRGKAIRTNFPEPGEDFSPRDNWPKFLNVMDVNEDELIFSEDTRKLVEASIFTLVEKTKLCRAMGVPLKRGNLLEGPYGCGKTLTAYVAAKKCVENGWTFIYLDSVSQLASALIFAKNYQPAMIFAEDIDRAVKGDERTHDIDTILNTIDGIDSKGSEIIVVLTTNHVEQLNQAMLRPGRLDAIIPVRPPDAKAVQKLIKLYARGLMGEGEDLSKAGNLLEGQIPAIIREVVERSKLSSISRVTKDAETIQITGEDLVNAANGMMQQFELLKPKPIDNRNNVEKAACIVGDALVKGIASAARNHLFSNAPVISVTQIPEKKEKSLPELK